ncbi:MAG: hypothetical protein HQ472_04970 [Ignavibacteria bacterium]|nr:hypothetical protein [Ignavibacteria bacterium]
MSKGGAGKVYFVLYLAVILELLIIIVERDEAEELLIAKQKESMRIVESILSQLQVGSGTEGINTRPQDQITIPPPGVNVKEAIGADIKPERKYMVEVGITDVASSLKLSEGEEPIEYLDRLQRFIKLSNVSDLKYEILYNNNQSDEAVPPDSVGWQLKTTSELKLKYDEMASRLKAFYEQNKGNPKNFVDSAQNVMKQAIYNVPETTPFKPGRIQEPEFYFSLAETNSLGEEMSNKKRSFVVNFEPREAGWYKLKFSSRTSKILGVSVKEGQPFEFDGDSKVNIGTVQLKVKDLVKVREEILKHTDGLPPTDLAKKSIEEFDAKIQEEFDKTDDLNARARIKLYAAIIKLTTPGLRAENSFKQNQGDMEFNIRVLKPQPQITDPKIADLKTVIRVFDKLSKIVLPMQVTPANGTTEFSKKPGAATIGGSGATAASTDGGQTKWIAKQVEIPVSGSLAPRAEPYVFELIQKNSNKTSEAVQCSVYVYPSKIKNEDEVKSFLEMSWGDAIELVVAPASGNTIKPDEFVMQFNMGGGTQISPLHKLNVQLSDAVIVPAGADKVGLSVAWKDPQTGEIVEIFNGSGEVGLKKPTIVTSDMRSDPISDNQTGEFKVRGFLVRPPTISETDKADVGAVDIQVGNASVRDMRTGQTFKVVAVGKPRKVSGQEYEVTLKLQGGRFPLTKGQVKGNVAVTISATARSQGTESRPRQITKTVSVGN